MNNKNQFQICYYVLSYSMYIYGNYVLTFKLTCMANVNDSAIRLGLMLSRSHTANMEAKSMTNSPTTSAQTFTHLQKVNAHIFISVELLYYIYHDSFVDTYEHI